LCEGSVISPGRTSAGYSTTPSHRINRRLLADSTRAHVARAFGLQLFRALRPTEKARVMCGVRIRCGRAQRRVIARALRHPSSSASAPPRDEDACRGRDSGPPALSRPQPRSTRGVHQKPRPFSFGKGGRIADGRGCRQRGDGAKRNPWREQSSTWYSRPTRVATSVKRIRIVVRHQANAFACGASRARDIAANPIRPSTWPSSRRQRHRWGALQGPGRHPVVGARVLACQRQEQQSMACRSELVRRQ